MLAEMCMPREQPGPVGRLTLADLRAARLEAGVPMEQVARRSRIPIRLLRELEAGRLTDWPTGLYGRTQLVRYARAAALDPDAVVAAVRPFLPDLPADAPARGDVRPGSDQDPPSERTAATAVPLSGDSRPDVRPAPIAILAPEISPDEVLFASEDGPAETPGAMVTAHGVSVPDASGAPVTAHGLSVAGVSGAAVPAPPMVRVDAPRRARSVEAVHASAAARDASMTAPAAARAEPKRSRSWRGAVIVSLAATAAAGGWLALRAPHGSSWTGAAARAALAGSAPTVADPSPPTPPAGEPPAAMPPAAPAARFTITAHVPESGSRDADPRTSTARRADGLTTNARVYSPTFATVGNAMFYHEESSGRSALMRADTDAEGTVLRVTRVVDDNARNFHVRPSPDGATIAFDSDRAGTRAVYLADADGQRVRRVSGEGYGAVPNWSPDGRMLSFIKAEPGRPRVWNLWQLTIASNQLRRLTSHSYGQAWGGSWFPDGSRIAYSHEDSVIVLDLTRGTRRVYRSPRPGRLLRTPAVSPDGRRIVFQVARDGAWLLDVESGAMRKVLDDASAEEYTWSPDGRKLAYHSRRSGQWGVWIMAAPPV